MSKILIMGGTFDPPHMGHMEILKNSVETVKPDEVYIIPAGTPPHKEASSTEGRLRLEMCACFRSVYPGVIISDMEIKRDGKSFTYETVAEIKRQAESSGSKADVFLCVGSDMLFSFMEWRNASWLLGEVTLVTGPRSGEDMVKMREGAALLRQLGGRVMIAPGHFIEISSSSLRERLSRGESRKEALGLLPPEAARVVEENRLYT